MELRLKSMVCVVLCALVGVSDTSQAAPPPGEAVYFVRHSVTSVQVHDVRHEQVGLHQVTLPDSPSAGSSVRVRPLWTRNVDAAESDTTTSAPDPDVGDDTQLLAALSDGLASTISNAGEAGALELLHKHQASGQQMRASLRIKPFGPFVAQLQVLELTTNEAVFSLRVDEKNIKGDGRAVMRLRDGMPIELRLQLEHGATRSATASSHLVHVADLAYDPRLELAEDLANYQDYVGQIEQTLAGTPFNGTFDDAGLYSLTPTPQGELQPHMVSASVLPGLERSMGFGWVPLGDSGRTELALGARARLSSTSMDDAILVAHTGPVLALDADGKPLKEVQLQTVMPRLYLGSHYTANESQPDFPFRLPPGLSPSLRDRIQTFRMLAMAEVYTWDSVETVPVDGQSAVNAGLRLERASPTRVTVFHDREPQRQSVGWWTVVVPLDADGREIPSQQVTLLPIPLKQVTTLAEVPLAWESREVPFRSEIAAEKPISQLQLRHYQWALEPRTWDFRRLP